MRLREILTSLVDEAKVLHWDAPSAIWVHQRDDCPICAAAIEAQTLLSANFLDFQPGDEVRIGEDLPGLANFGIVEHVGTVINVTMGYPTARGIEPFPSRVIGKFNASKLTRIDRKK